MEDAMVQPHPLLYMNALHMRRVRIPSDLIEI
jgi:hypothetical protein